MDKSFDFSSVGKRLPYTTTEGFFDNATKRAITGVARRRSRKLYQRMIGVAASVVVACFVSVFYIYEDNHSVDELLTSMSDSELELLVSIADSDLLFNEEI